LKPVSVPYAKRGDPQTLNLSEAHEHKGAQSQSLTDKGKSSAEVVDNAISKASDFLNDHPALTLGLTLGMAMQSWEKEEPAIEGAVNEAAAGVETQVEAAEQKLGTIFRSGGSKPEKRHHKHQPPSRWLGRVCDLFAIRLLGYHCLPHTSMPSVTLHVVEFTLSCGFES
jgi:hypothetical protein